MEVSAMPMESLAPLIQAQLAHGGTAHLVVTGYSMHPTLRHRRDAVALTGMDRHPRRGDLILYRRESGQYVLHRIVSCPKGDAFFCAGDNQWQREAVTRQQILGVVKVCIRGGKRIPVDTPLYRLYVGAWIALLPVRRPILYLRRCLGALRRKGT